MIPIRPAAKVDQFDTNASFVVTARVVSDPARLDPALGAAVTVNIEMPGVPGTRVFVMNSLTILARSLKVGKLGAMDDHQVNVFDAAPVQPVHI